MAQLTIHGNWRSIAALTCLVATLGIMAWSVVSGESTGIWLYLFSLATMVFGFWSKEDHLAVSGIVALNLVLVLDILLRIALLGFTECKAPETGGAGFSIWFGCPGA